MVKTCGKVGMGDYELVRVAGDDHELVRDLPANCCRLAGLQAGLSMGRRPVMPMVRVVGGRYLKQ